MLKYQVWTKHKVEIACREQIAVSEPHQGRPSLLNKNGKGEKDVKKYFQLSTGYSEKRIDYCVPPVAET